MRSREGNEGLARSRAEERSRWQKKKETRRREGKNKGWRRRGFRREEGRSRRSGVSTLACEIHTGGSSLYYREFSFGSYCKEAAARATSHFS